MLQYGSFALNILLCLKNDSFVVTRNIFTLRKCPHLHVINSEMIVKELKMMNVSKIFCHLVTND